jgi:hypothetical protein
MSVKDDMMRLVNKKASVLRKIKRRQVTSKSYVEDVINFLDEIDQLSKTTDDQITYYNDIKLACQRLDEKLKTFDSFVYAEVKWHDSDETDWRQHYAEGVTITWSNEYITLHPNADPVEYIDYNRLLLEDL